MGKTLHNCIHTCEFTAHNAALFKNPWSSKSKPSKSLQRNNGISRKTNGIKKHQNSLYLHTNQFSLFLICVMSSLSFHIICWRQSGECSSVTQKLKLYKLKTVLGYRFYALATKAITSSWWHPKILWTDWSTTVTIRIFSLPPYISLCTTSYSTLRVHRPKPKNYHVQRITEDTTERIRKKEMRLDLHFLGQHKQRFVHVGKLEGNEHQVGSVGNLSSHCLATTSVHSAEPLTY